MTSEAGQGAANSRVSPAIVALVAPDAAMERQARTGKAWPPFAISLACALLAAGAHVLRADAHEQALAKIEMSGQLQSMSDRQIADEVQSAARQFIVMRVGWGAVQTPVWLLGATLALVALIWFLKGRVKASAVFPVAAATLLPNAIANLLDAITAFNHAVLPASFKVTLAPRTLAALLEAVGHPLAGPAAKLAGALDFYSLWGALLLGFGVSVAGSLPLRRALTGTLVAWLCYRLLTSVAFGG